MVKQTNKQWQAGGGGGGGQSCIHSSSSIGICKAVWKEQRNVATYHLQVVDYCIA